LPGLIDYENNRNLQLCRTSLIIVSGIACSIQNFLGYYKAKNIQHVCVIS